jgi:chloramphenicol-sensitive protein RarD
MDDSDQFREQRTGVWFALAAYGTWGIAPVYFMLIAYATPVEIIAHRIVWSVLILGGLILARRQLFALRHLNASKVRWLAVSGTLVAVNWGVFVWALHKDRMLETSLGYYINPLVNMLLGGLFLGERLRGWQKVAVLIASLGVCNEIFTVGVLPWAGLTLAFTFGFYGLVRKKLAVDATIGLAVETTLMLPLAIVYLVFLTLSGAGSLAVGNSSEIMLLALGGIVTVVPLVCFAAAALRLPLTVLGFFQYLAPSLTALLAIFVYGEAFTFSKVVTFSCIWLALLIFSVEGLYHQGRLRQLRGEAA